MKLILISFCFLVGSRHVLKQEGESQARTDSYKAEFTHALDRNIKRQKYARASFDRVSKFR